jgi:hypothetical protein
VRELFLVRKESRWATGLIVLGITVFLAACQNGGAGASNTGTTDPNTAFAEYGARTNTPTGPTGNVPSRRGSGFTGGSGAHGGNSQSGLVWLFNDASTDPVDLSLRTLATS